MPRRFALCWAAAVALVASIVAGPPAGGQESPSGAALMQMEPSMKLTCEVSCSETKLRTAVARLTWTGPGTLQGRTLVPGADDAAAVKGERIDASVYADGFAGDQYASFSTVEKDAEMTPRGLAADEEVLPAYKLHIVGVKRDDTADTRLLGLVPGGEDAQEMKVSTVTVEGLEPGLNYTWRLVVETDGGFEVSDTVVCQAPVCTADMLLQEEEDQP